MKRLTIKNIGPVKNIEIDLNRINIFIGPQSSGKSTVAKIISFCQWLEKDCIANQSVKHIDAKFVNDKFIIYHDISSYLRLESFFHYQSEILDITYTTGIMIVNGMQKFDSAGLSKNAYIPSERNVISIPGIMNVKMPDNYILDFIDDWQVIRDKYKNGESLNLLDLDVKYSYDKETNEDRIVLKNGDSIPYSQASSGLQSLAPLCVYVDYITRWIYANKEYESALQRQKLRDAMDRIIRLDDIDEWIKTHQKPYQYRIAELENRLSTIKATNVVIEEPEQNLFPKTQVNLLYYILSSLDHNRDHLVVTTHSPYILYGFFRHCSHLNIIIHHQKSGGPNPG